MWNDLIAGVLLIAMLTGGVLAVRFAWSVASVVLSIF